MQAEHDHDPIPVPGANHQGSSSSYSTSLPRVPRPSCGAISVLMFGSICVKQTFFCRSVPDCRNCTKALQILEPRVAVCFEVRHRSSLWSRTHLVRKEACCMQESRHRWTSQRSLHKQQSGLPSRGSLVHDACRPWRTTLSYAFPFAWKPFCFVS